MTDRATPHVPVDFADLPGWLRRIAHVVNALVDGKHNAHGSLTLATSTTITTVADLRVGGDSRIFLEPTTANAAAETVYVSGKAKEAFTLTHTSAATNDRTYDYLVVG